MSKNQRQTPRKPATKFAHLRKKMPPHQNLWLNFGSPRDICVDALAVISEAAESDSEQVRRRARNALQALGELGAVER